MEAARTVGQIKPPIHLIQKPPGRSAPAGGKGSADAVKALSRGLSQAPPRRRILRNHDCDRLTRSASEEKPSSLYEDQMGVHKHSVLNLFHKAAHQIREQIQAGFTAGLSAQRGVSRPT